MPVCESGGPNRPCGDVPSLFAGVRQSPRYDSGRAVSQGLGCTPVFLRAFDYDYEYFVVFVQRFLEFLLTISVSIKCMFCEFTFLSWLGSGEST